MERRSRFFFGRKEEEGKKYQFIRGKFTRPYTKDYTVPEKFIVG